MKHITIPVEVNQDGVGRFRDLDNDDTDFEAVRIADQDEEICLVPTDLKPDADHIAAEIAQACNSFDELLAACEAQDKYERHAVHCSKCGKASKWCETGWALWNIAGNLRNSALAKGRGTSDALP
jgi:hypothetical protein